MSSFDDLFHGAENVFRAGAGLNGDGGFSSGTSKNGNNANNANNAKGPEAPEKWERPIPLDRPSHRPSLPLMRLPAWLSAWVEAESRATQTPCDLAAMLGLAVCGAGLAKKVRVRVRPGWSEPTNIFTVAILPSGERKSAVYADAMVPVQEYESDERQRMEPVIAAFASEHEVMVAKLKHLQAKAAKAEDPVEAQELGHKCKQLAIELARHHVPEVPQMYCDDTTPEMLGKLLALHGGRMLQAGAEGTAFEIAKGKYSESPNFEVYLKGHAGDPLRTDRVNRTSDAIESPALSMAVAVQPDVIHGLAEQASMRGRGFLARFLYAMPHSLVGNRAVASPPVPEDVALAYRSNVRAMWELTGGVDEQGRPVPHVIPFGRNRPSAVTNRLIALGLRSAEVVDGASGS